jgi:glutamyl-tRNA synthetase
MNGEHIRAMALPDLVGEVLPFAQARYGAALDVPRFERAVELAQERATTLVQIADQMEFLFVSDDELEIDEPSWEKLCGVERVKELLDATVTFIEQVDPWPDDEVDVRPVLEALGLKPKKSMHALYTAIEGRSAGLPLFPSIALLGRASSLRRLRAASARL